jgi:hypothetical protein
LLCAFLGVWTTAENKSAAVQLCFQCLFDGRLAFAEKLVVADRTAYIKSSQPAEPESLINKLSTQLRSLADQPDGTISAKHLMNGTFI